MAWEDEGFQAAWRGLWQTGRTFVQRVNGAWIPTMETGQATRAYVRSVGVECSAFLEYLIATEASVRGIEPVARLDRNDPTYDLAGRISAAKAALMDVTTEAQALWNLVGGQEASQMRDAQTGVLAYSQIGVSVAATAAFRSKLTAVVTALN